ncbi:NFX1-type zinc finger-containing protein 1-like isoform X1 [Zootermopsis nevadensis]|uniref:NFX1-type zinc finger-containing protein 1-like isoform X1 n=1 Tax=Zootermopsis nevadensis TaxID=136037 RepID=UPI000B8EB742|nr:NFX1-type zinc finger-containing protein 1-like isoform X1 [Zootermopsis nevadensis]
MLVTMTDNQNKEDRKVKRNHHQSQSHDSRSRRASTTSQHRVWRRSDSEVRTHQEIIPPRHGETKNKVWRSSSENRAHKGVTSPGIKVLQYGGLHRELKDKTHKRGAFLEPDELKNRAVQCGAQDKTHKEVACTEPRTLQDRQRQSRSVDRTHQGGTFPGPKSSQYRLGQSICEASIHKSGRNPGTGVSRHRLGQSGSENGTFQSKEVPNTNDRRVTVAVVMKLLAQRYGGYVGTKEAAELVQICKPEFLHEIEVFVSSSAPDTDFLSDFATFCLSTFKSLPSSICTQFQNALIISLQIVEISGDAALKDRFTRLQAKLAEHMHKLEELDARFTKQNFRSVPVLPLQADAFQSSSGGAEVTVTSVEQRYLSVLFFSLYEAFMGRIRDGIRSFRDSENAAIKLKCNMRFFRDVQFMSPVVVDDRLCLATSLAPLDHLTTGTLVCFSCNGFRSLLFATVVRADSQIVVWLFGNFVLRQLFEQKYVMADSGLFAEPSVSVLLSLQQLQVVPLKQYLVEGATVIVHKHQIQEQSDLDSWQHEAFSSALTHELCVVLGHPGSGKTYVGCTVARNSRPPVLVICKSHSGLDFFLRQLAPLSVARLSDRTKHEHNQQRRKLCEQKNVMWKHLRTLELDLALLARNDGVVSLSSLRESGVVCDAHFWSFTRLPNINSVFYSWLIDEAKPSDAQPIPHSHVSFSGISPLSEHTVLSAVQSSLRWAERLENVERQRSDVTTNIRKLQEQWGSGEDVTQETHIQRKLYRLLAFKLQRLRTRLTGTLPSDRLRTCRDVWQLKPDERWGLYFAWVTSLRARLLDKMSYLQAQLILEDRKLKLADQLIDLQIAQQRAVVGVTAEEATKLRSLLEKLAPKTVIVDEATNITEAQLVTCLPQSCQRIVLLGEPRAVQDAASLQKAHLPHLHSLVYRLVEKGIPISELKSQHRMQSQVARVIVPTLYPGLEDHSSVINISKVKGVNQNVFFVTHEHLGVKVGNVSDYQNLHEADFLLALCHHLVLQGYNTQDITILTTYPSQQQYLQKECESSLLMQGVQVLLVEDFRGQECKIVLVSTVHQEGSRPSTAEYISVMLTRAQEGLYVISNLQQLAKSNTVWHLVQKSLEKSDVVGLQLLLRCQVHPDELTAVSSASDFSQIPEGGCMLPCNYTLKCGHTCHKQCHISDLQHDSYQCKQHQQEHTWLPTT